MFPEIKPYQQDIINKTLETTKSTLIQLPTGGGKTIISKEIAIGLINNFNKKILFIAPKIVLMEQTLETFKGLKPQKVHGSNNKFDKNHNILISTLQTASRRNSLNPDVIIIDEVHFGYEKKMLNKIMEYNPNARIIGLSATPFDENGYPFKGFDVIINDYDLVYMIKNKYLVPLRSYILVKPDLSDVDIIAGDYEINQLSEAVSKNTIIMEIVATSKSYIEKSIKTIVFAVDINHAELLKTAFQNEGFATEALHSKSEKDDSEVIERFKKGYIKVLVSVLKLTTGFDVPETDLAIIARPTKSQNLYKQMVGRVLRIVDLEKTGIDKNFAILLDCGNVIENLGKPLEPIIPKDELEKKTQKLKCKYCESENIKLKKSDSNMYWECQDCGFIKELENKNHYTCCNCNKKYSYENGEFELINKTLYLNCECGYDTAISMATGDEEFREIDSGINIYEIETESYVENSGENNNLLDIMIEYSNNKNKKWKEYIDSIKDFKLEEYGSYIKNWKNLNKNELNILNNICYEFYDVFITYELKKEHNVYDRIINTFSKYHLNNFKEEYTENFFNDWLLLKEINKEQFELNCLSNINSTRNFDMFPFFERIIQVQTYTLVDYCCKYKFYELFEYIVKSNKKNNIFDYSLTTSSVYENEFEDIFNINNIDYRFVKIILENFDFIDLAECFNFDSFFEYISDEEDEIDDNLLTKNLRILNNFIVDFKNLFLNFNLKILIYGKKYNFEYFEFEQLKKIIRSNNIKNIEQWHEFVNNPNILLSVPQYPNITYKKEWKGWNDWLDSKEYISENTFKYSVDNQISFLNYMSRKDDFINYFKYLLSNNENNLSLQLILIVRWFSQNEEDISRQIKDENITLINQFETSSKKNYFNKYNTNNISKINFLDERNNLSYEESKKYLRNIGIVNLNDWEKLKNSSKFPKELTKFPERTYLWSGWIDIYDWLSTKEEDAKYLPYLEAKEYIKNLGINSKKAWNVFKYSANFPYFIPIDPFKVYKCDGYKDWLDLAKVTKEEPKKILNETSKTLEQKINTKNLDNSTLHKFQIGKIVIHKKFGKGKVIDSERNTKELFLTIDFNGSVKKILSSFLD